MGRPRVSHKRYINLMLPEDIFLLIKQQARIHCLTRTEHIRSAVVEKLQMQGAFEDTTSATYTLKTLRQLAMADALRKEAAALKPGERRYDTDLD